MKELSEDQDIEFEDIPVAQGQSIFKKGGTAKKIQKIVRATFEEDDETIDMSVGQHEEFLSETENDNEDQEVLINEERKDYIEESGPEDLENEEDMQDSDSAEEDGEISFSENKNKSSRSN